MKTYYYIPNILYECDELNVEHAYEFPSNRDIESYKGEGFDEFELSWLVEEMANDYVSNHDGWEVCQSWHGEYREFAVWNADKTFIGKFEVLMEYEPRFDAWRKK
jgi:hypothetical protein